MCLGVRDVNGTGIKPWDTTESWSIPLILGQGSGPDYDNLGIHEFFFSEF